MEKKQIYAITAVIIILIAAVGVYYFASNNGESSEIPEEILDAAGNPIVIPNSENITVTAASPSIADILCYMGYASNIICVSNSCDNPELREGLQNCGSYSSPDTDAISNADATVSFIDSSGSKAIDAYNTLRSANMNVVYMYGSSGTISGIDSAYLNVKIIGAVMGNPSAADELISKMKNTISYLDGATANADAQSVIIATGFGNLATDNDGNFSNLNSFDGSGVYLAGAESTLCGLAGSVSNMECPVPGARWSSADTDWISTSSKDVDVLMILWTNKNSMPNDDAIDAFIEKLKTTAWANCNAVTTGNIFFIGGSTGSDLSRVTPYTVEEGLPIISLYVNPEMYAATAGGNTLSWADLPSCIDDDNVNQLIGYTKNKAS